MQSTPAARVGGSASRPPERPTLRAIRLFRPGYLVEHALVERTGLFAVLTPRSGLLGLLGVCALAAVALLAAFSQPNIAPVATILTVVGALAAGVLVSASLTPAGEVGSVLEDELDIGHTTLQGDHVGEHEPAGGRSLRITPKRFRDPG